MLYAWLPIYVLTGNIFTEKQYIHLTVIWDHSQLFHQQFWCISLTISLKKSKCSEAELVLGKKSKQWLATRVALTICCCFTLARHGTAVDHIALFGTCCLLASPWPAPLARCSQGRHTLTSPSPRFNLRHQDRPDACKGAQIELSEIWFLWSLLPPCLSHWSPSGLFFFLSSTTAPLASSVHEPGRHIIGSAEQHIGVVPARLGLVGEAVCVVESLQRGVDVVVVPTRRMAWVKTSGYVEMRRTRTSACGKNQAGFSSQNTANVWEQIYAHALLYHATVNIGGKNQFWKNSENFWSEKWDFRIKVSGWRVYKNSQWESLELGLAEGQQARHRRGSRGLGFHQQTVCQSLNVFTSINLFKNIETFVGFQRPGLNWGGTWWQFYAGSVWTRHHLAIKGAILP